MANQYPYRISRPNRAGCFRQPHSAEIPQPELGASRELLRLGAECHPIHGFQFDTLFTVNYRQYNVTIRSNYREMQARCRKHDQLNKGKRFIYKFCLTTITMSIDNAKPCMACQEQPSSKTKLTYKLMYRYFADWGNSLTSQEKMISSSQ